MEPIQDHERKGVGPTSRGERDRGSAAPAAPRRRRATRSSRSRAPSPARIAPRACGTSSRRSRSSPRSRRPRRSRPRGRCASSASVLEGLRDRARPSSSRTTSSTAPSSARARWAPAIFLRLRRARLHAAAHLARVAQLPPRPHGQDRGRADRPVPRRGRSEMWKRAPQQAPAYMARHATRSTSRRVPSPSSCSDMHRLAREGSQKYWDRVSRCATSRSSPGSRYFFGPAMALFVLVLPLACPPAPSGSYLFYAQHNFPGIHIRSRDRRGASRAAAAESSSYMAMGLGHEELVHRARSRRITSTHHDGGDSRSTGCARRWRRSPEAAGTARDDPAPARGGRVAPPQALGSGRWADGGFPGRGLRRSALESAAYRRGDARRLLSQRPAVALLARGASGHPDTVRPFHHRSSAG